MKPLAAVALGLWGAAILAFAGEPVTKPAAEPVKKPAAAEPVKGPAAAEPLPPSSPSEPERPSVVTQNKAALMFSNQQIGQLQEGTRVTLVQSHEGWAFVRATFGANWCQGWMRKTLLVPDSLADVGVLVGRATRQLSYDKIILQGSEFVNVPVKFEPTDKSPARVYFRFDDTQTADLYLTHGSDTKVLPYGFLRRRPMSKRRSFETDEKAQTLLLKSGEPRIETYVFAVPTRARAFRLVLKDIERPVRIGR